jgi:hypothetical protein
MTSTGHTNETGDPASPVNEVPAPDNALVERVSHLTAQNNALTGSVNELTGRVNELTQQNNELTGLNNVLTARVNDLTASVNALSHGLGLRTGEANSLTGQNNALTGRIIELTAEVKQLTGALHASEEAQAQAVERARSLRIERDEVYRSRGHDLPTSTSTPLPAPAPASRQRFVVVANHRTGSTWLVTMLGLLPDVATDYELKWEIDYAPAEVHRVLDEQSPTLAAILDTIASDRPIVGSKLIFDPVYYTPRQHAGIAAKFDAGTRVVHLTRNYREILLSHHRGTTHKAVGNRLGAVGRVLRAMLGTQAGKVADRPPVALRPNDVFRELSGYLLNDLNTVLLAERFPYIQIDYADMAAELGKVTQFIGTGSTTAADSLIARAPTEKLASAGAGIIANLEELEPMFEQFETLRRTYVLAG